MLGHNEEDINRLDIVMNGICASISTMEKVNSASKTAFCKFKIASFGNKISMRGASEEYKG